MNKIFYISDLHFNHENIITYDKRPFKDITEMEDKIIENWNNKVDNTDTVYILGDFSWGTMEDWIRVLEQLNGHLILIRGNHDKRTMDNNIHKYFDSIKDYDEIIDNERKVILSHYPILFYKNCSKSYVYMLYGHLHITEDEDFIHLFKKLIPLLDSREDFNKLQLYNCWCGFYNYTPVTLDEIIERWQNTSDKEWLNENLFEKLYFTDLKISTNERV